jgi:peroxiredoxin
VVLVNFWATWCPPCRVEMPGFQRVYEARRERGFTIVGLSVDAAGSAPVKQFLAEHGITYPVAMANTSAIQGFGRSTLLPTSYLIDRQGRVRHEVRGYFTEVTLSQAVERLLDEPAEGGTSAPVAVGGAR